MIVYFDTSALIKRYITEPGTPDICAAWDTAEAAVSCWLLYPEMIATLARKRREAIIPAADLDTAEAAFRRDWLTLTRVACDDHLIHRIDDLHRLHRLRGADSTHLAAALAYRELADEPTAFACADVQLRGAAHLEGLKLIPE
jgi:predicted nucleic acid-binding protein